MIPEVDHEDTTEAIHTPLLDGENQKLRLCPTFSSSRKITPKYTSLIKNLEQK
jgi:hypothetical protein